MTNKIDTSPAALATIILLVSEGADAKLILTRLRSFLAAEKEAHEKAIADLTRERESARATLEAFEEENKRNKERAERAEADAAAAIAALRQCLALIVVDNGTAPRSLRTLTADDWADIVDCEAALSSTAGRDLLAQMERMRAALREARLLFEDDEGISSLIDSALADKEPTP